MYFIIHRENPTWWIVDAQSTPAEEVELFPQESLPDPGVPHVISTEIRVAVGHLLSFLDVLESSETSNNPRAVLSLSYVQPKYNTIQCRYFLYVCVLSTLN